MKISVVVPCYNEEESLPIFYEEIKKVMKQMKKIKFELIFINDGSKDATLDILRSLARNNKKVRYISFSRNFGKEAGILAGLEAATGDYICMMDADLQDPPSLLIEMYDTLQNSDYDCVATRSVSRNGYSMVDAILSLKEYNRYSKGIFSWVGFNTKWLTFENQERVAGTTKWNFWKLFAYSMESIIGFSTVPLLISSIAGILFCIISFIMIIVIICKTLIFGDPVSGWPSTVCIIFFVSGIQLFCLGIMGQYLAKTYLEVKNRPIYIIKETEKDVK